ncbi:hypothetical protein B0H16DRAFT_1809794 [Mycena metata]|uniref:HNH nuclease domain-containing protein n=1 Tax=Mycena metata TaxID=1033252 RepID=A0AAD7JEI7_9AGAR|nr:hypothetical protein B0H16DRAFT_1809794 [Mycena metata]
MAALPHLSGACLDHEGQSLWPTILSAEQTALDVAPSVKTDPKYTTDRLIGIRVLVSCSWIYTHIDHSRLALKGDLDPAAQYEQLQNLGLLYRNHILRVFRSNSTNSIPIEDSESDLPLPRVARYARAKMRSFVTRCQVTGLYDTDLSKLYPAIAALARAGMGMAVTQCANPAAHVRSQRFLAVHDYPNILTMRMDLRHLFDQLDFWFEEVVGEENTYTIVSPDDLAFQQPSPPPKRVTFRVDPAVVAACDSAGTKPPKLPSPALLAIRAACSRVAHVSGAAKQFDQIRWEVEESDVMKEDGGSAGLLEARLLQLSG